MAKIIDPEITQTRKAHHIDLAFLSQTADNLSDGRFYYEPILSAHPQEDLPSFPFLRKKMKAPIWISSMTGGTEAAYRINTNLAKVCREFGLGMGLGSCRPLLESNDRFKDFDLRPIIGDDSPFYANLGIAQLEELIDRKAEDKILDLVHRLRADGLIIHVNPLQEWLQPEGDTFQRPPIETILHLLDVLDIPLIVKEVGQGMGPESLRALLKLPLEAVDFGAFGGTNFAKLELLRASEETRELYEPISLVGHTANEMVEFVNDICEQGNTEINCKQIIISGGVQDFLHGYYLINKICLPAVYGQASAFLKYANGDYEVLKSFTQKQIKGLALANSVLKLK